MDSVPRIVEGLVRMTLNPMLQEASEVVTTQSTAGFGGVNQSQAQIDALSSPGFGRVSQSQAQIDALSSPGFGGVNQSQAQIDALQFNTWLSMSSTW